MNKVKIQSLEFLRNGDLSIVKLYKDKSIFWGEKSGIHLQAIPDI